MFMLPARLYRVQHKTHHLKQGDVIAFLQAEAFKDTIENNCLYKNTCLLNLAYSHAILYTLKNHVFNIVCISYLKLSWYL